MDSSERYYDKGELELIVLFLSGMLREPNVFRASAQDFLGANSWIAPVLGHLKTNGNLNALEEHLKNRPDSASAFIHPANTKDRKKLGEETSRIYTVWVILPLPPSEGVPNRFHFKEGEHDKFYCIDSGYTHD
jgi:hypothetical protein